MRLNEFIINLVKDAKRASGLIAHLDSFDKNRLLRLMAKELKKNEGAILAANRRDIALAKKQNLSTALIDRLLLNKKRINDLVDSLIEISKLKDPVGEVIEEYTRPNGLLIKKIRVPIGLIAIIYESRPNVTSDCVGLCLKSGNALILKGGREALNSNRAIFKILDACTSKMGLKGVIKFIDTKEHKAIDVLLGLNKYIDLVIPRGGEGLIQFVCKHSKIPVIKHYKGVCHVYVDSFANLDMAEGIVFNAKVQRPGVCNAMETLLVHKAIAKKFLPKMIIQLKKAHVEIRGCPKTYKILKGIKGIKKASELDWYTEYLDLILSVKVVKDLSEAIAHINKYGTAHSDAIITDDKSNAMKFLELVDSACVYVNASTRFTDGGQFGLGTEIGISTDKIHARGPMGLRELDTYKYIIFGKGQVRE